MDAGNQRADAAVEANGRRAPCSARTAYAMYVSVHMFVYMEGEGESCTSLLMYLCVFVGFGL